MEAMSSAMKTMRDKEPRHRQRREGISKENWRKLIKAHKSQTLIRRSGCEITNPQPNHTLIVSSKDKTHTGEHVLQIIRGLSTQRNQVRKWKGSEKPGTKGDTEMQHERGHGGHPEQNEVP
ncbi:hypothetical protein EVAR_59578_1 [Eumeta japonica]|uniref:Uncharacterized protein n=1 Tax=Eumeta variegata TaxID=151549 RepID=A0A4C1Z979_EUMVA|nr:hypothetical protein EVAR_59578_1 [Eumeta japonica]